MEQLSSERLTIRSFMTDDGEDLYDYLSREEVVRFEPYRVFTREMAIDEAARRAGQKCFLAVCLKNREVLREKVIGNLYFWCDDSGAPIWQDTYEYGLLKEDFNK